MINGVIARVTIAVEKNSSILKADPFANIFALELIKDLSKEFSVPKPFRWA